MGKARIISHEQAGTYQVEVVRDVHRLEERKNKLADEKALLARRYQEAVESGDFDVDYVNGLVLRIKALEKEIAKLDEYIENPEMEAKAIDYTLDFEEDAYVGTIEVPGTRGEELHIQPGYRENEEEPTPALFDATRDGQLQHVSASTPAGTAFNLATLPVWQRWRPTYRFGTILDIDYDANTAVVCIEYAESFAQNLPINPDSPSCDSAPGVSLAPRGFQIWVEGHADSPLAQDDTPDATVTYSQELHQQLQDVNDAVNAEFAYLSDKTQFGSLDYWDTMDVPGASGDCEDFALTKAQRLLDAGYPAGALKLEVGDVKTSSGTSGHAWLAVQTTDGNYGLDINYRDVSRTSEWRLYLNRKIQIAGSIWEQRGTKLIDVPIEYMFCDAAAFDKEDRVVVKFENQSWSEPKVIGFRYGPERCRFNAIVFSGIWADSISSPQIPVVTKAEKYNLLADSTSSAASYPSARKWIGSFGVKGAAYGCGGGNDDYPNYGTLTREDAANILDNDDRPKTSASLVSATDATYKFGIGGSWSTQSTMALGLAELAGASTDAKGYVFGGAYPVAWEDEVVSPPATVTGYNVVQSSAAQELTPGAGSWSSLTASPAYVPNGFNYGHRWLEFTGGKWRFHDTSVTEDDWVEWEDHLTINVPGEVAGAFAFGIHDKAYLVGGGWGHLWADRVGPGAFTPPEQGLTVSPLYYVSRTRIYPGWTSTAGNEMNPATGSWSAITDAPYSSAGGAAAGNFNAYSNAIIFNGVGYTLGLFNILRGAGDYRQALDAWASGPFGIGLYSVWPCGDGLGDYGWMAGGLSADGSDWVANPYHQIFDPATQTFTTTQTLSNSYVYGNGGAACL